MSAYGHPGPAPELADANAAVERLENTIRLQSNALSAMRVRCATYSAETNALAAEKEAAWDSVNGREVSKLREALATEMDKTQRLEHELKLLKAQADGARVDLGSVA